MKKNYSLILRKIIFAFNSISVIGIAIFILYTTRKICDAYVASDFLEKVNAIPANPSALVGEILVKGSAPAGWMPQTAARCKRWSAPASCAGRTGAQGSCPGSAGRW